jgi:hypothetical protein
MLGIFLGAWLIMLAGASVALLVAVVANHQQSAWTQLWQPAVESLP